MTDQSATAIVSANAAVITAVVALVLNHRAFITIENRLTSFETRVDRRFEAVETDLKASFKTQVEFDKRLPGSTISRAFHHTKRSGSAAKL